MRSGLTLFTMRQYHRGEVVCCAVRSETAMASFGEGLRREREMRGVSLEEISTTTKINMRFLRALEAEDFAKLPGGLFTRSFLRAYADYLGLEPDRVLAEYQLIATTKPEALPRISVTRQPQRRKGSVARFVPLLIALPLLAAGYILYRYAHRPPEASVSAPVMPAASSTSGATAANAAVGPAAQGSTSPSATSTSAGAPAVPNPAEPNSATSGAQSLADTEKSPTGGQAFASNASGGTVGGGETASGSRGGSPSAAVAVPQAAGAEGDLVLQVMATERTWVAVEADGKTIFQRTLNPDEVKTFTAKDSFDVLTGNAQGTVLTLNGTRQKSLGREGESKRIHLARQSLQQPAP